MAEPTTFHLVRHAAHALLADTLAGRMVGVPLSPEGQAQAERLADRLAERFAAHDIAAVVTSPVQRAMDTAAPLAARFRRLPMVDTGFEEIDFGRWTGRRFDALAADPAWRAWNRLRSLACCPGGESMHQAQSRALLALHELRRSHPGQSVAVVSHADIIKALLAPALGLSLDHLHRLRVDPASVSSLVMFDEDMRVDLVNG